LIEENFTRGEWFTSEELRLQGERGCTVPIVGRDYYRPAVHFFDKYRRIEISLLSYWLLLGGNQIIEEALRFLSLSSA
jgi:hypothetical protein